MRRISTSTATWRRSAFDASRRIFVAGLVAMIGAALWSHGAQSQSAGVVTITVNENIGSVFGAAEVFIDGEQQGVLGAGCCMYVPVEAGAHELTLRWPDHTVSATFETDGEEPVAFHLSAQRALRRIEE